VCSGIEAATVAWHQLGWEAAGFAEIEPFPAAVLAHHYPAVKNLGDMTNYKEWDLGTIDLLVGGTPCQSFSVAGLRKGLADPRGNLALVYCGILDHFRPKWCVWENVPGVLSSNGGRDFGSFLGALAELGYGFAYRVLDAQYFGVAQRRRRVFVVGHLGDWRAAAEVLFEPESLRRDTAPSREKREGVASSTRTGAQGCSHWDGDFPHPTLNQSSNCGGVGSSNQEIFSQRGAYLAPVKQWPAEISSTLDTTFGTKQGLEDQHVNAGCPMFVPAQPIALAENTIGRQPHNGGNGDGFTEGGPMYTLDTTGLQGVAQPIVYDTTNITSPQNGSNPQPGDPCFTLAKGQHPPLLAQPISYALQGAGHTSQNSQGSGWNEEVSFTLNRLDVHGVAQPITFGAQMSNPQTDVDMVQTLQAKNPMAVAQPIAPTLTATNDPSRSPQSTEVTNQVAAVHAASMAVRRLTPVECERLQGFPDGYTNIPWRKAPESPDGPRYKALGNSMAVPVMGWIGKRIQMRVGA